MRRHIVAMVTLALCVTSCGEPSEPRSRRPIDPVREFLLRTAQVLERVGPDFAVVSLELPCSTADGASTTTGRLLLTSSMDFDDARSEILRRFSPGDHDLRARQAKRLEFRLNRTDTLIVRDEGSAPPTVAYLVPDLECEL